MLPDPLENFGQSIVATLFFSNNILQWMTSGYWELASEFKPLIHTWSLGVEEQYYIFFPLLILILWRLNKNILFWVIPVLFAASLITCQILSATDPSGNFYLLHTRAWELLAGSLCAFFHFRNKRQPHNGLSILGLLLIVFSIFWFDNTTPFPSLYALAPVVGAGLILLFAGAGTWTGRLLSNKGFVGIGLISYSAYLWHQPFFAFARINSYNPPADSLMFILALISLGCSWLSWKFVETPFRSKESVPLRPFLITIVLSSLGLIAFGLLLHVQHGIPKRMFAGDTDNGAGMYIGFNYRPMQYALPAFPESGDKKNVLVVGDSFARDFINAGIEAGRFKNNNLIYREEFKHCYLGFDDSLSRYRDLLPATDIIIMVYNGYKIDCLLQTIDWLQQQKKNLQILIIGPKDFGYNLNKFMQLEPDERADARTEILPEVLKHNQDIKQLVPPEMFVDIISILSEDGRSIPVFTPEGSLISQDRKHLTRKGAQFIGKKIFQHPFLRQF